MDGERPPSEERSGTGTQLSAISNAVVRVFKEQYGRGPTKVRSHFAGPDTLICVLEDSFTPAERTLAELGEHQRLRDVRMFFQDVAEDQFREIVEGVLNRPVRSFMSAIDTQTDTAVEVFVLGDGEAEVDAPDP
ncbi:MAG: hypothetical protein C5B48_10615 [Candidatus Rokuibacteriota bacterium]|nr:MAG: hypothetical protein C5B48_10615 [Candidatus Rokubacteria bacterium]